MAEQTETNAERLFKSATQFTYTTFGVSISHYLSNPLKQLLIIAEEAGQNTEGIKEFTRSSVWAAQNQVLYEGERIAGKAVKLDSGLDHQGVGFLKRITTGFLDFASYIFSSFTSRKEEGAELDAGARLAGRAVKLDSGLEQELNRTIAEKDISGIFDRGMEDASALRAFADVVEEGTELWKAQNDILGRLALRFYADTKVGYDRFVKRTSELAAEMRPGLREGFTKAVNLIKDFYDNVRDIGYRVLTSRSPDPVYDSSFRCERPKRALKVLAVTKFREPVESLQGVLGEGYEFEHTGSFEEGRAKLSDDYDLVISGIGTKDGGQPNFDAAYSFVRYATEKGKPVIVMTGWGISEEEVSAKGAKGVINLPFKVDEVHEKIKGVIAEQVPYFV